MSDMARYSRQDWGARPPKATTPLPWSMVDTLYIHYTSMLSDQTGDPREKMRGIQRFHQDSRGWNDFAYNWAFSVGGDILEGRGWEIYSAATGSENRRSQAVVFLGGDKVDRDDVTGKGREALRVLVNEANRLSGKTLLVKGHRQAMSTSCPGDELMAYILEQNKLGWRLKEPAIKYPKNFFLFAQWYLGEGLFAGKKPHDLRIRPKALPGRFSPGTAALMLALKHFLARRKSLRS